MASTDITAPLARIKALIEGIAAIGPVYAFDLFSRTDLSTLIVSEISGTRTMRAWWITGPTMVGKPMVQSATGWLERTWLYTIYGIEGLTDDGTSITTLRAKALAICDALDPDRGLNGTCHRSDPTSIVVIENRATWAGVGASYAQLTKQVVTLSTP